MCAHENMCMCMCMHMLHAHAHAHVHVHVHVHVVGIQRPTRVVFCSVLFRCFIFVTYAHVVHTSGYMIVGFGFEPICRFISIPRGRLLDFEPAD